MRAIGLVSITLAIVALTATDAGAASGRWCASYRRGSENCGYATLEQCQAQVLGLGAGVAPTRSLGQGSGPVGPGPIHRGRAGAATNCQAKAVPRSPKDHKTGQSWQYTKNRSLLE